MTGMNPEVVKRELIWAFEFIKELDQNPELLKKLPDKSIVVDRGKKKMFISTKKDGRTLLL